MAEQVIELTLQVIHLKAKIEQLERERDANTTEPE
jgi:outer membrane murein-binding lipoprotein Lpp